MSLGGPQTRLGDEFGYTSGSPEPRDLWDCGRRYRGGWSFLTEKVFGIQSLVEVPRLLVVLTSGMERTRSGPFRVTGPSGRVGGMRTDS